MKEKEVKEKIVEAYRHATPDLEREILQGCGEKKLLPMPKKRRQLAARICGIAACFLMLAGTVTGFAAYHAAHAVKSTVSLDVNPSVELKLNRRDRVLSVRALNGDGEKIIAGMDFSGSDVQLAVNALIGSMLKHGYLSEIANSVLLSVDSADADRSAALQKQLAAEIDTLLQTDTFRAAVLSQTISETEQTKSLQEEYGITAGKAQLICELLAANPQHTAAELASLSINELNLLRQARTAEATQISSSGNASDKAYIGEVRAKELAFAHAGVNAEAVSQWEIELDTYRGAMVYEVDFSADGISYECEIDARSGAVAKFEQEKEEPRQEPPGAQAEPSDGPDGQNFITEQQAKELALAHVGVTSEQLDSFELEADSEDGVAVYEAEFSAGGFEYDVEIDAVSGAVRKAERQVQD